MKRIYKMYSMGRFRFFCGSKEEAKSYAIYMKNSGQTKVYIKGRRWNG